MANLRWFKLYTEARQDKKLEFLTDPEFRIWFNLLCFAAEQEERGTIPEIDFFLLALETAKSQEEELEKTLEKLEKLKIINRTEGKICFVNFQKRQYEKNSDRPEEIKKRVTRYREKKEECNAAVTPCNAEETLCNAAVTLMNRDCNAENRIDKIREDKIRIDHDSFMSKDKLSTIEKIPEKLPIVKNNIPYSKIVSLYSEILPELPQIKILSEERKGAIKARWNMNENFQDLEFWKEFFLSVKESDFLMGRNEKGWKADFDFLLTKSKFIKILEKKYDGKKQNIFKQAAESGIDNLMSGFSAVWNDEKTITATAKEIN